MMYTIRRYFGLISIIVVAALASSCAETSRPVANGKGSIRGIAAIVDSPNTTFLIQERSIGNITYKNATGFALFDDLSYDFSFDIFLPEEVDPVRVATQFIDVVADMEYTLILTGSIDNPSIILWEDVEREWAATETVFEPFFANFSPAIGDVDVYFATPGTTPAPGNAVATLSNGERSQPADFEQGSYEIILTAAGDPANVLFTSGPIVADPAVRPIFAIFDSDPTITGPVAVNLIREGGGSIPLSDPAFPAQIRFYHAAFGTENVDGYYDDDFSNLIFSDVGFSDLTSYVDIASVVTRLSMTAVGNTGAIIAESALGAGLGTRLTITMAGDPANVVLAALSDDGRPLSTSPQLRIANLAINQDFINIYLLEPGTEITDQTAPIFGFFPSQQDSGYFGTSTGMLEMTVTAFGDIAPIAPSVILDLNIGDVIDVAILDTVDPTVLEIDEYSGQ